MWRNADVLDFVGWLATYNASVSLSERKAGFYGMDLYSLYHSMDVVIEALEKQDPTAAARARERYGCFNHFGRDAQSYGYFSHL